jgi:uncharacterized membrane protein YoaK (UPF0700 family)
MSLSMPESSRTRETPIPASVPVLLSFVAGYVDSFTYLALFGLFVAQVTSSFVIAGAEVVTHDYNVAGKLLVTVVFVLAAILTAALIAWARNVGRAALPWMLALETALLAVFAAMLVFGLPVHDASDPHGIVAGLIAAAAMGSQSVVVRLLMKGFPQTNVMTGNMTQLGIAVTDLIFAWRRLRHSGHDAEDVRHFAETRDQLLTVMAIAGGFLIGAAAGATAFITTGLPGAFVAVAIVFALALWVLFRERAAGNV